MYNQEYFPKTSCMALTIRKEHRLMVINKTFKKTLSISWKTLLYAVLLTLANIVV